MTNLAIRHVVDMIEGLDGDYNDAEDFHFSITIDPLDESIMTATVTWNDEDRDEEEYEIKIARVV